MDLQTARKELLPYLIGFSASALAVFSVLAVMPSQAPPLSFMGKLRTTQSGVSEAALPPVRDDAN